MNMTQKNEPIQLPNGDEIGCNRYIEARKTHPEYGELYFRIPLEGSAPDLNKMNTKELDFVKAEINEAYKRMVEELEQKSLEQDS